MPSTSEEDVDDDTDDDDSNTDDDSEDDDGREDSLEAFFAKNRESSRKSAPRSKSTSQNKISGALKSSKASGSRKRAKSEADGDGGKANVKKKDESPGISSFLSPDQLWRWEGKTN